MHGQCDCRGARVRRGPAGLARFNTPSRLFIYYNERALEGTVGSDSGAQIRDGIKSVAQWGDCPETEWPYDISQFAIQPPQSCYADASKHLALVYESVDQDLNDLRGCLAAGFPFVFGFTVYQSFESDDVAQTGIVPMPRWFERPIGGHAVMAVGYDDASSTIHGAKFLGAGLGRPGLLLLSLRVHDGPAVQRFLDDPDRRIGDTSMSAVVRYWPAVVAGLYLLYVLAAGKLDQVAPALAAFLAAFGINQVAASAHAKIDALN